MLKYYEQKKTIKKDLKNKKSLVSRELFKQQYKENFKTFIIESVVIAALLVMIIALYPMVHDMYAAIPPEMQGFIDAFGGLPSNIAEYFSIEGGQTYILVGVIYAAMLGIGLIRKEIKDGSAEFLYTLPVNRGTVFRAKFLVLILNLVLFNVIALLASIATIYLVEGAFVFSLGNLLLYFLFATIIQLQVGIIIFSYTAITKKNASLGLALGYAIFSYIISVISRLTTEVEFLKYITPYTYIAGKGAKTIMDAGLSAVDTPTLIIFSTISVVLLMVSYLQFKKSDII